MTTKQMIFIGAIFLSVELFGAFAMDKGYNVNFSKNGSNYSASLQKASCQETALATV